MDRNLDKLLVHTYGSEYQGLMQHIKKEPELAHRVDLQLPVTVAEILHAVRHEMALTLADVIRRRTELGATGLPSMDVLQRCAELMTGELGWSIQRREREVDSVVQSYPFHDREKVLV